MYESSDAAAEGLNDKEIFHHNVRAETLFKKHKMEQIKEENSKNISTR